MVAVSLTRRAKAALVVVFLVAGVFVAALPYADALAFIIRAADLPGTP
mgnify:FL=1